MDSVSTQAQAKVDDDDDPDADLAALTSQHEGAAVWPSSASATSAAFAGTGPVDVAMKASGPALRLYNLARSLSDPAHAHKRP